MAGRHRPGKGRDLAGVPAQGNRSFRNEGVLAPTLLILEFPPLLVQRPCRHVATARVLSQAGPDLGGGRPRPVRPGQHRNRTRAPSPSPTPPLLDGVQWGKQDVLLQEQWYGQVTVPDIAFEDCLFYHTIELPGRGLVVGPWDLRGTEADYTGHVDFKGKRVLEIGPASGGLTVFMERSGAEVDCFDGSQEHAVDILPSHKVDVRAHEAAGRVILQRFCNAWLYTKQALNLRASVRYGDIYAIAEAPGSYDIVLLGAILLHLRSPFSVVHRACLAARDTVIVTDLVTVGMESAEFNLLAFNPSRGESLSSWWSFSPGAIINMLELHGFTDHAVTYHNQMHYPLGDYSKDLQPARMFTVVAHRARPGSR